MDKNSICIVIILQYITCHQGGGEYSVKIKETAAGEIDSVSLTIIGGSTLLHYDVLLQQSIL